MERLGNSSAYALSRPIISPANTPLARDERGKERETSFSLISPATTRTSRKKASAARESGRLRERTTEAET